MRDCDLNHTGMLTEAPGAFDAVSAEFITVSHSSQVGRARQAEALAVCAAGRPKICTGTPSEC
jgi:hypothetical protein